MTDARSRPMSDDGATSRARAIRHWQLVAAACGLLIIAVGVGGVLVAASSWSCTKSTSESTTQPITNVATSLVTSTTPSASSPPSKSLTIVRNEECSLSTPEVSLLVLALGAGGLLVAPLVLRLTGLKLSNADLTDEGRGSEPQKLAADAVTANATPAADEIQRSLSAVLRDVKRTAGGADQTGPPTTG